MQLLNRGRAYLLNTRNGGPDPITDRWGKGREGWIHRELQMDPSGFMAALEWWERLNKLPPGKPLYARIIHEVASEVKYNRETGADHEAYLVQ